MNLYMVHVGFYDPAVGGGIYESHMNFFVAARDAKEAKSKTLEISEYKDKKMHIDGIKEISTVDGYKIILEKNHQEGGGQVLSYDESKKL